MTMSGETRLKTEACYGLNLEQHALPHEFEDDPAAVDRLLDAFNRGESGQHTAERIRTEHAAEAEREQVLSRYRQDGYQITGSLPQGAMPIQGLLQDGEDLTPETHAACPGRCPHPNPALGTGSSSRATAPGSRPPRCGTAGSGCCSPGEAPRKRHEPAGQRLAGRQRPVGLRGPARVRP